jgi:hypothetical protein
MRHMRSLRSMRRDNGWIHTLLEEAENERMVRTCGLMSSPALLSCSADTAYMLRVPMQPIPAFCVQSPHCACAAQTVPLGHLLANVSAGSQLGLCAAQHLLTFLEMKQPGPMFRAFVLLTQGIFFNLYFLCAPGLILLS